MGNKVEVVVSAIEQGFSELQSSLKDLQGDIGNLGGKTKATTEQISGDWTRLTASFAAGDLISKGVEKVLEQLNKLKEYVAESARYAARVETLGVAMHVVGSNAGYTSAQMDAAEQSVKKLGITTEAARQALTQTAAAQMDVAKTAQLARVAQDAAVIGGINSSEALMRMTQGIRSGETEVLRTIGINVNFENSYKKIAAALGKNTEALTEQEKVQARQNAVLEFGTNISGAYEASMTSTGKKITSLARYYDELKLSFGEAFAPALGILVDQTTEKLQALLKHFQDNRSAYKDLGENLGAIVKAVAHPLDTFVKAVNAPFNVGSITEREDIEAQNKVNTDAANKSLADAKERQRIKLGIDARAAQAAEAARAAAEKAAEAEINGYNQFVVAFNDKIRAIEQSDPALTKHEQQLQKLQEEQDKMIEAYPKEAASIRQLYGWITEETRARQANAAAMAAEGHDDNADNWAKMYAAAGKSMVEFNKLLTETRALELTTNLARIDSEERFYKLTAGEAAERRINLLRESLQLQREEYALATEDNETNRLVKLQLLEKIEQTERQLLENEKTLSESTAWGGGNAAIKDYSRNATNIGLQMKTMAGDTANAMQQAFSDGFFDIMNAKFNDLGKIVENFVHSVQRSIANLMAQQATNAIITKLGGLGASFFGGGGMGATPGADGVSLSSAGYGGWSPPAFHSGGKVVPRFHFGGLAADEIPAILQTGERVLDREHNALMENFANKTGSAGNVQVNVINQSGTQVQAEQQGQPRFDGEQMIVDVVLKKLKADPGFRTAMATGGGY